MIRKDSFFNCFRAHGGHIQLGPVTLGRDAFVGESSVLDINTSIGDDAQLGHSSALSEGQAVPDGQHLVGTTAHEHTDVDYLLASSPERSRTRALRKWAYSLVQVAVLFLVAVPTVLVIGVSLVNMRISSSADRVASALSLTAPTIYRDALVLSLVVFFGFLILGLVLACTVPRLLNLTLKAGRTYPLYGFHYWASRAITRMTNSQFFNYLFGDTSYIVHYLHLLGYDVTFEEQTGANFGLDVKHDNPYLVKVGAGTMAADGLSIISTDYASSAFQLSPVEIGSHSFFGNYIAYPSQSKTSENCLHATKVHVPIDGDQREKVGVLGAPSFEIPRQVQRDQKFDELKDAEELGPRLAAKNKHNLVTMALFLVVRWPPSSASSSSPWPPSTATKN